MSLSYSEQQAIVELEKQFSSPQHNVVASLQRWRGAILGLLAMSAVLAGLIVLASVNS